MSDYKIVCIDDELDTLELYKDAIEVPRCEVVTFSDPEKAHHYILSEQMEIACVISDLRMPNLSGVDIKKRLISKNCEVPFIIITGFASDQLKEEATTLNISKVISKPFSFDDLKDLIIEEVNLRIETVEEEKEMSESFLEETQPMLDEIEQLILVLEDSPESEETINTYFRLLHTIKGTSACLGLDDISKFSHKYEDYISSIQSGKRKVTNQAVDVLLKGLDFLKKLYHTIQSGDKSQSVNPEDGYCIFEEAGAVETSSDEVAAENETVKMKPKVTEVESTEAAEKKDEKLNVSVHLLETFLEQSGELTVLKNTIFKNLVKLNAKYQEDRELQVVCEAMDEVHKVSSMLQNQVSEIKKITLDNIYRPMKRVARDSARVCGKKVDFCTEGEDMRVDINVGKLLSGSLVHMIRNSIDHGVETIEDRVLAGKSETGKVSLSAKEIGEDIVIELSDDGKGLDADFLKKSAVKKGLYTQEEISNMSDKRAYHIIFEAGFSTAAVVTEISGRGVGMDMVRSSIAEAGGTIHIDSEMGVGTTFTIVIPIPRSIQIINSLMVDVAGSVLSVPLDNIAEVVLYEEGRNEGDHIHYVNGKMLLKHQEELFQLVFVSEILDIPQDVSDLNNISIVIIKEKNVRFGLVVDQINDIEEIIVKKIHPLLNDKNQYLGTTFIDDGKLSLILNVEGIAKLASISDDTEDNAIDNFERPKNDLTDTSEYMRFSFVEGQACAMPLSEVFRFEEISSEDIYYSGDLPLIKYRESSLIVIALDDNFNIKKVNLNENGPCVYKAIVVRQSDRYFAFVVNELFEIGVTSEDLDSSISDRSEISGTVFIDKKINTVIDIANIIGHFDKKKEIMLDEISQFEEKIAA